MADELQKALVERLRASQEVSAALADRIFDHETVQPPCAWVGVTADEGSDAIDLLATIHVWLRTSEGVAAAVAQAASKLLKKPPVVAGLGITDWKPDYSEVRVDDEHAATHALVRFKATAQRT